MANTLQVKRGAQASLPTLNQAELGFSTDEKRVYIGDGAANIELARYNNLPALPSDENLVGYWAFDDGAGTIAVDGSGNGNNGTLVNMEDADWVDGVVGKCLEFDGVDEYVDCGTFTHTVSALSVSCWIKSNTSVPAGSYSRIVSVWHPGFIFSIKDGNVLQLYLWDDGEDNIIGTINVNDDQWHHIVFTVDTTDSGRISLYVDGVLDKTETSNITSNIAMNTALVFCSDTEFTGLIDEVRIYNTALTADKVKALYLYPAGNKGTKISGLQIGGSPIPTTYTAAKCIDADADQTSVNIALNSARTDENVTTIQRPGGAAFSGSSVGVIKITLPQSWSSTMMKFFVDVFEFTTGKSFTLELAGYNYITTSDWRYVTANLTGSTAANNRVRFGHDGTKCCICIGETNSDWSYLKTNVRDFQAGHLSYSISQWDDGWSISVIDDLSGITFTQDIADSLIDASDSDTLDGQHGSYYANSGANSDITSMTGLDDEGIPFNAIADLWVHFAKGYIMGGYTTNVIEDLIFSSETSHALFATLDTSKYGGTGVNSLIKGYIMGGYNFTNIIEDLIFSSETSQAISATLDTSKCYGAGVNSSTKGYFMGGYSGSYTAAIEDLIFSSETSQAISATLDTAKYGGTGVNSSTKGYFMGGFTGSNTNIIEDLIFSSETSQAISATLDTAKYNGAGVNSSTKGYFMGGDTASPTDVIEDLIFSSETSQAILATLDTAKHSGAGVNSSTKGYIMGGYTNIGIDVIEDLIFSSETSQAISATLDTAKRWGAGVQYGYV